LAWVFAFFECSFAASWGEFVGASAVEGGECFAGAGEPDWVAVDFGGADFGVQACEDGLFAVWAFDESGGAEQA
jgi:hypothetical protein